MKGEVCMNRVVKTYKSRREFVVIVGNDNPDMLLDKKAEILARKEAKKRGYNRLFKVEPIRMKGQNVLPTRRYFFVR